MSEEGSEDSPPRSKRKIKKVMVLSSDSSSDSDESVTAAGSRKKRLRVLSDDGSDSSGSSVVCAGARRKRALPKLRDSEGDSDTSGWATDHSDAPKPAASAAKPTSGFASDSSEGNSDKCSICLLRFTDQEVGTPQSCEHIFCLDCITEWSKNVNTCPVDRMTFDFIVVRACAGGRVLRTEPVKVVERRPSVELLVIEDPTVCEVCGRTDNEETMLLCDGCDLGYHMQCLTPPLSEVPIDQWLCPNCDNLLSDVDFLFSGITDMDIPISSRSALIRESRNVRSSRAHSADEPSTSTGNRGSRLNSEDIPTTSRESQLAQGSNSRTTTTRRKSAAHTNRRRPKRRRTKTVIIEYEVQENGKFPVTKRVKRKLKKRRTKRRQPRTAARRSHVLASVRAALAAAGVPGAHGVPGARGVPGVPGARGLHELSAHRSRAGIPALSLFGDAHQLDYFPEDDEHGVSERASTAVASRPSSSILSAYRQARRKMISIPSPTHASSAPDVLSSILESQTLLHSKKSVVSISVDGSVNIKLGSREKSKLPKKQSDEPKKQDKINLSQGEDAARKVPSYPGQSRGGRGWGGGYTGNYHREQGSNSLNSRGGGYDANYNTGGYQNRQGNAFNQNNNARRDDMDTYNNYSRRPHQYPQGDDLPFERNRRQVPEQNRGQNNQPPQRPESGRYSLAPAWQPYVPPPAPPRSDPPPVQHRHSFGGFENPLDMRMGPIRRQNSANSNLEPAVATQAQQAPKAQPYRPLPEPPMFKFDKTPELDKSEDEKSDSSLVIDTEKYDPTEPTNDDDDSGDIDDVSAAADAPPEPPPAPPSPAPLSLAPPSPAPPSSAPSPPSPPPPPGLQEVLAGLDAGAPAMPPNVLAVPPNVLDSCVRAVLREHRALLAPAAPAGAASDDESEGDCPNFSIYSATSVHIANSSAEAPPGGPLAPLVPNDSLEDLVQEDDDPPVPADPPAPPTPAPPADPPVPTARVAPDHTVRNKTEEELKEKVSKRCPITTNPRNPIKIKLNTPSLIKRQVSLYDEEMEDEEEEVNEDSESAPSAEPGAVPGARARDAHARDAHATRAGSPATRAGSPATRAGSPATRAGSPATRAGSPATRAGSPATRAGSPATRAGSPATRAGSPATRAGSPATRAGSPATRAGSPATRAGSPATRAGSPATRAGSPAKLQQLAELAPETHSLELANANLEEPDQTQEEVAKLATGREKDATTPEIEEEPTTPTEKAASVTEDKLDDTDDDETMDSAERAATPSPRHRASSSSDELSAADELPEHSPRKGSVDRNDDLLEKMTESISETEDERSYTPCLDENKSKDTSLETEKEKGIEGLDTEMISEDEGNEMFSDNERAPSEVSRASPAPPPPDDEEGEIVDKKKEPRGDDAKKKKKKDSKKEGKDKGKGKGKKADVAFKKLSKSGKERNYRDKDKKRERRDSSDASRERKLRRKERRKDLERYDVRTLVGEKRRRPKDAFGRDVSPRASPSLSRSPPPARLTPRREPDASGRRRSTSRLRRSASRPRRSASRPRRSASQLRASPPRPRRASSSPRRLRPSPSPRRLHPSPSPRRLRPSPSPRSSPRAASPARPPRRRRRSAERDKRAEPRRRRSADRARKRRRSGSGSKSPRPKPTKRKKRVRSERSASRRRSPRRRSPRRRRARRRSASRTPGPGLGPGPGPGPAGAGPGPAGAGSADSRLLSPRTPPPEPSPPPAPGARRERRRREPARHRRLRDAAGPSKEVFTSGDNILVSVSFKEQERAEGDERRERRRERRRRRRRAQAPGPDEVAPRPVAIIDLERSPFRELTPSPRNVIVLSDSEPGEKEPERPPVAGPAAAPEPAHAVGPKTPPSPGRGPEPAPDAGGAEDARGPLTPPEPPDSPDAYDPYEPTRSASASPSSARAASPPRACMTLEAAQKTNMSADEVLDRRPLSPIEKVMALLQSTRDVSPEPPPGDAAQSAPEAGSPAAPGPAPSGLAPPGPAPAAAPAPAAPAPAPAPPVRIVLPSPTRSQPPKLFLAKPSPIKSDPIKPMQAAKLPRPALGPSTAAVAARRREGSEAEESPYSPGSSDFGDLFEPPGGARGPFDALLERPRRKPRGAAAKVPVKLNRRRGKTQVGVKIDEDNLKILDDLPSSAVEMQVKSKFLKKLNRQERVVEEVKLVLKPHYNKKHVTKDEYKDILRRAVPKICHNKTGEINPAKIQALVEAYVKKFRKKHKLGLV